MAVGDMKNPPPLGEERATLLSPAAGYSALPPGAYVTPLYQESAAAAAHAEATFPLQCFLFVVGFLAPPAWWVGACMGCCGRQCCQYEALTHREKVFQKLNAIFSILNIIFLVLFAIAYAALIAAAMAEAGKESGGGGGGGGGNMFGSNRGSNITWFTGSP